MAASGASSTLRSDARRNVDRIRAAAVGVFRERGLSAPLEDVAEAAGVSKATIFNRFGGRIGLIDAVVGELVAVVGFGAARRIARYRKPLADRVDRDTVLEFRDSLT